MKLAAERAAESGAILTDSALADNRPAEFMAAWPTLPEATRRAMLDLVRRKSID
jgi:hypothetical protein